MHGASPTDGMTDSSVPLFSIPLSPTEQATSTWEVEPEVQILFMEDKDPLSPRMTKTYPPVLQASMLARSLAMRM